MNQLLGLFFIPFIASALLFLVPNLGKRSAFVLSLIPLIGLTGILGQHFSAPWMQTLSIHFSLSVDHLSLVFLYLANVIVPLSILASATSIEKPNYFYGLILLLQGLLIGFFASKDLVFFTFFFEAMLLPLYFLIACWGGPERQKAAFTFIIYMVAGSVLMVVAVLSLFAAGTNFDIDNLAKVAENIPYAPILAAIFLLAFLVKTPIFPLHAWLPDAYCQAPVGATILLAAVLSKAGVYGILRISWGLFPTIMADWSGFLLWVAIIGMLYGAFAAWGQTDFKRLIAYSSLSHINFVLAALFVYNEMAQGGAILQSVNHAITICGLFLVAAWLEAKVGTTSFAHFSGLAASMPILAWLTLFFVLSAVALPGLNTFVSEVMVLYGLFLQNPWQSALLGTTVFLSVIYMLRFMHSLYFETPSAFYTDIRSKELLIATPLVLLIIWLGVYPGPLLKQIASATDKIIVEKKK